MSTAVRLAFVVVHEPAEDIGLKGPPYVWEQHCKHCGKLLATTRSDSTVLPLEPGPVYEINGKLTRLFRTTPLALAMPCQRRSRN